MDALKILKTDLQKTLDGSLCIVCEIDGQFAEKARNAVLQTRQALKSGKECEIVLQSPKKRRSTDANAYFHLLCGKIASVLELPMDEVKRNLVLSYGSSACVVTVPNSVKIETLWKYASFIGF